ncbi:response regulator [soil metagenome]
MSEHGPNSLRICLVDDDPDHVILIRRAIRELGAGTEVHAVYDGNDALEWLRSSETAPDLVLLDINMAGLNGFDVLQSLKADPKLKMVPVVMLTSSELTADIARAYELGASGYINKPSYLHDLRAVLGNTLMYWSAMKRATAEGSGRR